MKTTIEQLPPDPNVYVWIHPKTVDHGRYVRVRLSDLVKAVGSEERLVFDLWTDSKCAFVE